MRTLLAIDQGTTSTRAILFSEDGEVLKIGQKELKLYYPEKGWVEQNPEEIWSDVVEVCTSVLEWAKTQGFMPVSVGITNQRETTIVWDRHTGQSVYNAIVWQDRRTAPLCDELRDLGLEDEVSARTGLLLDPYFSGTKIAWILDNVEGVRDRAEKGELAFGTVDSYVLWRLTNGRVHATDATNASRTMLYNILYGMWDEFLLEKLNVPSALMPDVQDNISDFGQIDADIFGIEGLKVGGMAGDQQAALIGQGCFEVGAVKSTYGTGCFALMNIGAPFKRSENRLLTTIGYVIDGEVTYALEGSIFMAGAAVQWLRDGLELFDDAAQTEAMARSVEDNGGVYFAPAFTGLGAPHWRPEARAMISGLGRESSKAHIVRACLEAQGYQTRDLMGAMEDDSGRSITTMRVDGGLVANGFVCQFLADMLGASVEVPVNSEATAWGAAALAGIQAGVFKDLDDVKARWQRKALYEPQMDDAEREGLYAGWKDAVGRIL